MTKPNQSFVRHPRVTTMDGGNGGNAGAVASQAGIQFRMRNSKCSNLEKTFQFAACGLVVVTTSAEYTKVRSYCF
jgi:hypothetical protein